MKTSFDPLYQRYPSQRYPIYARNGMVNCSNPLAASAGLEILRQGGNAMDAAVAAAGALTVVEPTANGIGSDAFALVWSEKDQRLYGLNSSGPAPMELNIEKIRTGNKDNSGKMPQHGWIPVTVPGAPKAWAELTERFGRLSLAQNLAPAVKYAREGYPCSPNIAHAWQSSFQRYRQILKGSVFEGWFRTFSPGGKAPEAGDIIYLPDHADSLESIGETNAGSFYSGELARIIDAESRKSGGFLRFDDLAAYQAQWVEPIHVSYRGYDVCEIPPNGQGIVALMALNILKEFEFPEKDHVETYHRQLEAIKMAFGDAFRYVTDPKNMTMSAEELLSPVRGAEMARKMTDRAQVWSDVNPPKSGTVYLCCADREGNMVSFIQSNYMGFGSGIVVNGTGIALQNRGSDFSLDPRDINCLEPGKRTYHTIIPGFLMREGRPVGPFGVMGGYMQPQGHVQVVMNIVDFSLDPQQALDAPRWQWKHDRCAVVESRFDSEIARALRRRGHDIQLDLNTSGFGRGQMIVRLENGVYAGGTESRTDSNIACY